MEKKGYIVSSVDNFRRLEQKRLDYSLVSNEQSLVYNPDKKAPFPRGFFNQSKWPSKVPTIKPLDFSKDFE